MEYRQRRSPPQQGKKKRVFTPPDEAPASPQYTGHSAGLHPEDTPYLTTGESMQHFKHPAYEPDELEAGSRMTQIARRYNSVPMPDGVIIPNGTEQYYLHSGPPPVPLRANRGKTTTAQYQIPQQAASLQGTRQSRRKLHWLFFVGIAFLVMLLGYIGLNALGAWWQLHNNDSTYGRPRTFQTDAVVGHDDSASHPSHFIAINLNRHIIIIEFPGGDIARSVVYSAGVLLGDGQDLTPVTLSFADVNHDGRLDMLVHIADQITAFLNNGTKFVPPSNLINRGRSPSPTLGG